MRIARDDEIGLGGECAGEHFVIVRIREHHRCNGDRTHQPHSKVSKTAYTVPRSLDAVVASLGKQADRCVNKETVQHSTSSGGLSTSRDVYMMTVDKVSAKRAESRTARRATPC